MVMWRSGIVCAALVAACGGASGSDIDGPPPSGPDASVTGTGGGEGGAETGVPAVDAGIDSSTPVVCATGTADCDGIAANGCETNTLVDDARCGGCGGAHRCASGSSCQAGACVVGPATVVAAGTFSVNDSVCLTLDASFIYVASGKANGDVYRVSKTGGPPASIAQNQATPRGIAADAKFVYWASTGSGIVTRADPDGTSPKALNTAGAAPGVNTVSVDANGVYWGNATIGTVSRVDKDGMNGKQLAPAAGTLGAGHVASVVASGGFVYYGDLMVGSVMRVPADGSAAPSVVAAGYANARGISVNGTTVTFVTSATSGQVLSVLASGPPATPVVVGASQGIPVGTDSQGTATYWANAAVAGGAANTGSIMKKDGANAAVPLATAQPFPACIAVDASSVYWINGFGASVMRVAR